MAESRIYQNQPIWVVREFESAPVIAGTFFTGKELPAPTAMNHLATPNILSKKPNFLLQNEDTGRMYHVNKFLSDSIFGVVHVAKQVAGECQTPSSSAQGRLTSNRNVAVKVFMKDRISQRSGKTLESPHTDIGVTNYIHQVASCAEGAIAVLADRVASECDDAKAPEAEHQSPKRQRIDPLGAEIAHSMRKIPCHPNIILPVDCMETDSALYSVLEFFEGSELRDICDGTPLTPSEAKHVLRQLLHAVSYLQSLGICHRDISMENVLYNRTNGKAAVVIDFGMTVKLTPIPQSSSSYPLTPYIFDINNQASIISHSDHFCWVETIGCGTSYLAKYGKRPYIAPELLRREKFFHPMLCEMWAVGVMLFFMLVGYPPFEIATTTNEGYQYFLSDKMQGLLEAYDVTMDPNAIDLLQNILKPNPLERFKIEEILKHPWMQDD